MNAEHPTSPPTTHRFQAEVSRVLGLVIHSLYSNRDIFLRELLSNASDALDKLRFRSITEPGLSSGEEPKIRLIVDETARTLTIWDNGIGMNADALIKELGTVAHSGTQAFIEKLEQSQRNGLSLIGQFGVGFYSAYLVADRVDVISRAAGENQAWKWSSTGAETFSIEPAERPVHGTSITLHLKVDAHYLEKYRLQSLVEKYSDYLDYPIEYSSTKDPEARLNRGKALWQRRPADVTREQYEEFYRHLNRDTEAPLAHRHFQVEGTQVFTGLLFIPTKAGLELFSPESKHGVRLYIKRVLIMEHCEELLPSWLRFIRGVVDSEDLPLNVSREILQDSALVRIIRKQLVKQVLDLLTDIAKTEPDKYVQFWASFGKVVKEGLHFNPENKDRLLPLLRFDTSRGDKSISLADYKARMPEGQKAIYYVLAESQRLAESSPHTEALKKRGYEVLYLTDPVDSFVVPELDAFDGTPLTSASGESLDVETLSKEDQDRKEQAVGTLRERVRTLLQDRVSEVRVSNRLAGSPACLVVAEGGLPPHVERMLRATQRDVPKTKRILELNPDHKVIQGLERLATQEPGSSRLQEWVEVLYDQALIAEGSPLEDPGAFAGRLNRLLGDVVNIPLPPSP